MLAVSNQQTFIVSLPWAGIELGIELGFLDDDGGDGDHHNISNSDGSRLLSRLDPV